MHVGLWTIKSQARVSKGERGEESRLQKVTLHLSCGMEAFPSPTKDGEAIKSQKKEGDNTFSKARKSWAGVQTK